MIVHSKSTDLSEIRKASEKRLAPQGPEPPKKKLGMGDFLHLMITQLQYQDPMHPLNNQQFAAQLAQFSQLKQLAHLNKGMGTMVHTGADANKMMMVGFLGQEVTMKGNGFRFAHGASVRLAFRMSSPGSSGSLFVFDKHHQLVRTIALPALSAGRHAIRWDGITNEGKRAPEGEYTFEVEAMDGPSKPVSADPIQTGTVTGILFQNGQPVLEVNGKPVSLQDISHVERPEAPKAPIPAPTPQALAPARALPMAKVLANLPAKPKPSTTH
jgi:flagellar basal-body rod modification protein FlgD